MCSLLLSAYPRMIAQMVSFCYSQATCEIIREKDIVCDNDYFENNKVNK